MLTALLGFRERYATVQRAQDGLTPVVDLQLGEDVGDMVAHGLLADHHPRGDLAVAQALCDEAEDLQLSRGQFLEQSCRGR